MRQKISMYWMFIKNTQLFYLIAIAAMIGTSLFGRLWDADETVFGALSVWSVIVVMITILQTYMIKREFESFRIHRSELGKVYLINNLVSTLLFVGVIGILCGSAVYHKEWNQAYHLLDEEEILGHVSLIEYLIMMFCTISVLQSIILFDTSFKKPIFTAFLQEEEKSKLLSFIAFMVYLILVVGSTLFMVYYVEIEALTLRIAYVSSCAIGAAILSFFALKRLPKKE